MICSKCQSSSLSEVPAEIRLYSNGPRTQSYPPMSPSPNVQVCLDCGWAEFSIPKSWLSAGWLRRKGTVNETISFLSDGSAVVM